MDSLLKEERQQRILEALQENKRVTVQALSRQFGISEVTVRRDLHDLAQNGHLVRARRGALMPVTHPPEPPVIHRMGLEHPSKQAIAEAALALVQDGDSIFVGSGSTTTCFARLLASDRCLARSGRLTVITNALNIAAELAALDAPHAVVVIGGIMRSPELSLLGHIAEQTLSEVRVNKIFMGVQALSLEAGWTTDHLPEVATTRKILSMSDNLVILADHTKFGHIAAAFIAPVARLSTLVTDAQADPGFIQQIERTGVRVVVAG